jgi:hypothetical protein
VTHEVVFDAFDILDYVLRERFEKAQSVVARMSSAINRNKGLM